MFLDFARLASDAREEESVNTEPQNHRGLLVRGHVVTVSVRYGPVEAMLNGFICYSRENSKMCTEVRNHLHVARRMGQIDFWDDSQIPTGAAWNTLIARAIDNAQIFLLLLSPAFFKPGYIWDTEFPAIKARHAKGGTLLVPLRLRPGSVLPGIGDIQGVPRNAAGRWVPVTDFRPRDSGYACAVEQMLKDIEAQFPGWTP